MNIKTELFPLRFFHLLWSLILMIAIQGCDINEPKRIMNNDVAAPVTGLLNLGSISDGQIVYGHITIYGSSITVDYPVRAMALYIDGVLVQSDDTPSFILGFASYNWPDGEHVVSIGVFKNNYEMGILDLYQVPNTLLSMRLQFSNSTVPTITLDTLTWNGDHPVIRWKPINHPLFSTYEICRWVYPIEESRIIHVSSNRTLDSFIDYSMHKYYGGVTYRYWVNVTASNGDKSYGVNRMMSLGGIRIGSTIGQSILDEKMFKHPTLNELYMNTTSRTIWVVDANTNTIRLERHIGAITGDNEHLYKRMALSPDGSLLYFLGSWDNDIDVVNASTLTLSHTIPLAYDLYSTTPFDIGRDNRLYHSLDSNIIILDGISGTVRGSFKMERSVQLHSLMRISKDLNYMYFAYLHTYNTDSAFVYKIDIRNDSMQVLHTRRLKGWISQMYVSDDGNALYVLRGSGSYDYPTMSDTYLEKWDAGNLGFNTHVSVFPSDTRQLRNFAITGSDLYVTASSDIGYQIMEYGISSLSLKRRWYFYEDNHYNNNEGFGNLLIIPQLHYLYPVNLGALWAIPI